MNVDVRLGTVNQDVIVTHNQHMQRNAKAMAEFGVWRLASIIHRLRNEDLPITTLRKQSVTGKPYAEYRLEA